MTNYDLLRCLIQDIKSITEEILPACACTIFGQFGGIIINELQCVIWYSNHIGVMWYLSHK